MKKTTNPSAIWRGLCAAVAGVGLLLANSSQALTNNAPQQITGTNYWYSTNTYILNGGVFVMSNAVLHIEAGTVIKGHSLGGQETNVAALYVTQGGKIYAEGTATAPIIFTADTDDITDPTDLPIWGPAARGLWGGLVVFGSAPLNSAVDNTGNAATPIYEVYEGLSDITLGGQQVFRYGGTNDNDDSGIIRYVSIRHGGVVLASNKEINGLSMGAVGRGTTIEYVESYCAADDGFEFFGGTVNTKYLVSSFNDDDSFDTDMGYNGTNQFWFAIQAPDKRNYGMELNSQLNERTSSNNVAPITPQGTFKVYNLTIIGAGVGETNQNGGGNDVMALRPFASPSIYNAVFTDFNGQGIRLDAAGGLSANNVVSSNYATIKNTLWYGFVTNIGTASQTVNNSTRNLAKGSSTAEAFWTTSTYTNEISNPLLIGISRTNDVYDQLDPRPQVTSPAYQKYAATPAGLTTANYRGAFGTDLWIAGWTALSAYGLVATNPAPVSYAVPQQITGTNNYWTSNNIYLMTGAAFVMSNAVLHIGPGTVIKGHNTGSQGTNVAALYVTQGGKIYAEGTATAPIIFTADVDNTDDSSDLPIWGGAARGLWGGLVVFGSAALNSAVDNTGNGATPIYEVYEGLSDITLGGQQVFRYGGTNDNDDSGIIRYVSIRHGGAVLAPNKEINGLSMGAVGRGTTIEYVESYCAADDGFEFFGGTVNTKYLVSSFNDDDSFDTDMGYKGTNQFWFAIQAPDKRNYGMVLNSQLNERTSSNNVAPITPQGTFKVYNLTIIGAGVVETNQNGGGDDAIALRPFASPSIYNAVFTDFNGQGIRLDAAGGLAANNVVTSNYATIKNTLWFGFVTNIGTASQVVNNSTRNLARGSSTAEAFWTTSTYTNEISNPLLIGISRTNDVYDQLDPRPQVTSPAYQKYAATPAGLTTANYRGAFGTDLWIAGWTALSAYGLVATNPAPVSYAVPQQITGTNNYWTSNNIYLMTGAAFVMSNAVLHIGPGTVIKGHNTGSQGTNVAALYVTQGGKIYAEGTATAPIIFTADVDNTDDSSDLPIWGGAARGLWGGLVVFGSAALNSAVDNTGNGATPIYEVYEGLSDITLGGQQVFRYGGTNDNDDSGIIRYVSIRHGGAVLAPNKEINGLSMGAVGRGTTIEYVESYCAADDGFEFFGGTVNTKYLVSSFNDDDSFDTDMGYKGTNQFWFAIQAPDKRNYGMELNSQLNERTSSNNVAPITPQGTFKVYNLTIIGAGVVETNQNGGGNDVMALRPFASPSIYNAVFTDFNGQGIRLDAAGGLAANNVVTSNYATIKNTLWFGFVTNIGTASQTVNNSTRNLARGSSTAEAFWTTSTYTNEISNPLLIGISRTNDVYDQLDPRPQVTSPAYQKYAATPAGLTTANYRGAFGTDLWIAGWTALSAYGLVATNPAPVSYAVPQQITGTNNYWTSNNIYLMTGAAFVMSNAVLHIGPGTVIKGHNTGSQGTNVAALYVTQGGKIYAEGTATAPIIFTADVDNTDDSSDLPIWGGAARGLWGGLVVFGSAALNSAVDNTGNGATPIYEVYEGLSDITLGGQQVFRYGGTNDNDDSGIIRYVSIRHGGAVLAPNKEINGLSMGAVGRGTTIEYVESYCAADDGFEFFGGTVNTKYLVSSFNDDDSFDTDMGYKGTNQFWFAIQAPDKRNYGMELNSQLNERTSSNNVAPITPQGTFKVYNLTIIGAGVVETNQNGGGDDAIALRPFASPSIYNAVFTDFNGQGIRLDAAGGLAANNVVTSNYATIKNTLWFGFVTNIGTASQTVNNSTRNLARGSSTAEAFWTTSTYTNEISNPLLIGISRTNDLVSYLDPRPMSNSPAYQNYAVAPAGLTTANYRGAFGTNLWIAGWTALAQYSVLTTNTAPTTGPSGGGTPTQPTFGASQNGANIQFVFSTQVGFSYQVQGTTNLSDLPIIWVNEGSAVPGTGGSVTSSVPTSLPFKAFRVKVQ